MSLVSPRPAIPTEVEHWAARFHRRLHVKPEMTGLWQVNGRSNASFDDYVRFDLSHVESWSFWVDIAIIVKTVPRLLSKTRRLLTGGRNVSDVAFGQAGSGKELPQLRRLCQSIELCPTFLRPTAPSRYEGRSR